MDVSVGGVGPGEPDLLDVQPGLDLANRTTRGSSSACSNDSTMPEVAAIARAVGGRRDLVSVLACDAAVQVVQHRPPAWARTVDIGSAPTGR